MSFLIPGNKFGNNMGGPSASLGGRGIWTPSEKPKPQTLGQVIPKPLPMNGMDWAGIGGDLMQRLGANQGSPGRRPQSRPVQARIPTRRPGSQPSRNRVPAPAPQQAAPAPMQQSGSTGVPAGSAPAPLLPAGVPRPGGINPNANDQTAPPAPTGQMGAPTGGIDWNQLNEILAGMGAVDRRY